VRRGNGFWACCPLHSEKTPSLKFYEGDRGWVCFGCHKGGDAITLYQELYRVEPVEAARMLAAAFGVPVDEAPRAGPPEKPKPGRHHLECAAKALFNRLWDAACAEKWKAQAALDRLHAESAADWDNPVFVAALRVRSLAEERLAALECYTLKDMLELLDEGGALGGQS
jgi:DNA primase